MQAQWEISKDDVLPSPLTASIKVYSYTGITHLLLLSTKTLPSQSSNPQNIVAIIKRFGGN